MNSAHFSDVCTPVQAVERLAKMHSAGLKTASIRKSEKLGLEWNGKTRNRKWWVKRCLERAAA
jgi:hypothetical protein